MGYSDIYAALINTDLSWKTCCIICHLPLISPVCGFKSLYCHHMSLHGEMGKCLGVFQCMSLWIFSHRHLHILHLWHCTGWRLLPQFQTCLPWYWFTLATFLGNLCTPFKAFNKEIVWGFNPGLGNNKLVPCKGCHFACRYLCGTTWGAITVFWEVRSSTLRGQGVVVFRDLWFAARSNAKIWPLLQLAWGQTTVIVLESCHSHILHPYLLSFPEYSFKRSFMDLRFIKWAAFLLQQHVEIGSCKIAEIISIINSWAV